LLLVIDVGNTNTKLGVYAGARLVASSRLTTRREQTADEYGVYTQALLRERGVDPAAVRGVALSSTVPRVESILEEMARRWFGVDAVVAEPGVNVPVPIRVDYPREVGPDRVVKVAAAVRRWTPPLIVIDFGTATVFDCVAADGAFIGGAIAPGIAIATEALTSKAARLFRVELTRPKEAIGRNTVTNIQSGIIYGYAGLVDGLVERLRAAWSG
jgi:type III pantothenate kinase